MPPYRLCTMWTCFIIGIISRAATTAPDDKWNFFERAFGHKHLSNVVSSSEGLEIALEHEETIGMDVQGVPLLGCSSYNSGQKIARAHNCGENSNIVPIYISREEDTMCFIIKNQYSRVLDVSNTLENLNILTIVPSTLKLDSSIFEVIDVLYNFENTSNYAVKSFIEEIRYAEQADKTSLPEYMFDMTISYDPEKNISSFHSLNTYNLAILKNIFHLPSAISVEQMTDRNHVITNDSLVQSDVETYRYYQWNKFHSNLLHFTNKKQDVCHLNDLPITNIDDKYTIPISYLLTSKYQNNISAACIAYVASIFAIDSASIYISISSKAEILNYRSRSIQQSGIVGVTTVSNPYANAGLLGTNQVVGVADTGLEEMSCYFKDISGMVSRSNKNSPVVDMSRRKVVQYIYSSQTDTGDSPSGHGTHVCGIVAGSIQNGNLFADGAYAGVAPNAKLAFIDLAPYGASYVITMNVNDQYPTMQLAGAYIYTNSWGSTFTGSGYYCGNTIDTYLYNNPNAIIFFAVGNSGGLGMATLTQESSAKNVVAVGASESTFMSKNISNIAYFSSRGPAYDGRYKPDIIAPGASIASVKATGTNTDSCSTTGKSGTSMSSPGAAGSAALVRQYFMDSKFWASICNAGDSFCTVFTPSGVLIKSILLHSGAPMALYRGTGAGVVDTVLNNPPPDNYQGYGRIQLSNVLPLPGTYNFYLTVRDQVQIFENSELLMLIKVTASTLPFRVTISWYDPPAISGAAKALVNDIDLVVVSPSGVNYYGNGGSTADRLNNNEQVTVFKPVIGKWRVRIITRALPMYGSQKFSLVCTCIGSAFLRSSSSSVEFAEDANVFSDAIVN